MTISRHVASLEAVLVYFWTVRASSTSASTWFGAGRSPGCRRPRQFSAPGAAQKPGRSAGGGTGSVAIGIPPKQATQRVAAIVAGGTRDVHLLTADLMPAAGVARTHLAQLLAPPRQPGGDW